MKVEQVVPILNVTDVEASVAWFGKLGWEPGFQWRGTHPGPVDVDAVHERALAAGLEITHPPTDEPWNVREFHVRHPDGHVFRISRAI